MKRLLFFYCIVSLLINGGFFSKAAAAPKEILAERFTSLSQRLLNIKKSMQKYLDTIVSYRALASRSDPVVRYYIRRAQELEDQYGENVFGTDTVLVDLQNELSRLNDVREAIQKEELYLRGRIDSIARILASGKLTRDAVFINEGTLLLAEAAVKKAEELSNQVHISLESAKQNYELTLLVKKCQEPQSESSLSSTAMEPSF